MSPQTPRTAKQIFGEAYEKSPKDRSGFLDVVCGDDAALRAEVKELLAAFESANEFLVSKDSLIGKEAPSPNAKPPAPTRGSPTELVRALEGPGSVIGRYKLLQEIGHGGFGTVFMAEQREPIVRKVALKVIKLGMDTRQVVGRFQAERQALAMMDHPNIARVLDAGATDTGRPYFVMELVKGVPLTRFCDDHRLPPRERLTLFTDVCQAVQHAHQKGVIHRDLKPSNVLVSRHDDTPVVKIIDFGIAKAIGDRLTDQTVFTEFQAVIGTPAYMSPEQAGMSDLDIDTRSDIYSLGVLLYELLTGTTPFDERTLRSASQDEMRRLIREVEPQKPSTRVGSLNGSSGATVPQDSSRDVTSGSSSADIASARHTDPKSLARLLRGDLDWIVMKCLEKDRTRRYETANGLAMEVHRYLKAEPVLAGPPKASYRLRKFVRRNRGFVCGVLGVFAALAIGVAVSTGLYVRAERARTETATERDHAQAARKDAVAAADRATRTLKFLTTMLSSADPHERGKPNVTVREMLDDAATQAEVEWKDHPEIQADVYSTIGMAYSHLGETHEGVRYLRQALELRKQAYGDEHELVAESLHNLAWTLHDLPDYPEAERLGQASLEIRLRLLGNDHPTVGESLALLGDLRRHAGDFKGAESYFDKSLRVLRDADVSEDNPRLLEALNDQALVYKEQLRFAEAETVLRRVVEAQRRAHPDHPNTLISIANLAEVVGRKLGRLDEAEALLHEALVNERRLFPDGSVRAAADLSELAWIALQRGQLNEAEQLANEGVTMGRQVQQPAALAWRLEVLSDVLRDSGRLGKAEEASREALELARQVFGEDDRTTGWRRTHLAIILRMSQNYDEAVELSRQRFESARRVYETDRKELAWSAWTLADNLSAAGDYEESEALYRSAAEQLRIEFGPKNTDLARCLSDFGRMLRSSGRPHEAEPHVRESVEIMREVLGPDHLDLVGRLQDLSDVLRDAGKLDEAEATSREALALTQRVLGENHINGGWRYAHLAEILVRQGRLDEALDLARQRFELTRTLYSSNDREVAFSEWTMAGVLKANGRYDEAEPLFRSAIDGLRRELGMRNKELANCEGQFAQMFRERGRPEEAEPLLRDSLAITRETFGPDHIDTARWLTDLSDVLRDVGKLDEAEEACRESIRVARGVLGETHKNVAWRLGRLSGILQLKGQLDDAVDLARQRLDITEDLPQPDYKELAWSQWGLAGVLAAKGEYDESEALYHSAIDGLRREFGRRHVEVAKCETQFAWMLCDRGRFDEAEPFLRDALDIEREASPTPDAETAYTMVLLGSVLTRMGKVDEAEPLLREALDIRLRVLPPGHWLISNTKSTLGGCLAGLGKFGEAEPLLLHGYNGMKGDAQAFAPRKREALERLVSLYETWHAADPDQGHDAQAAAWRAKLEPPDHP